ncbi:beta strand repeat-containing protein [Parasphingorhabdus sp.]|uniref:beta strand repeat-containing protein n=1 Tax=Parasphingorhabdus sp. TaxID=2709688 RepID=UPI003A92F6BE
MTSRKQQVHDKVGAERSRKLRWLSGSSATAAAFLLVSAPQPVLAQSHLLAPDFNPRDIRISAPMNPLAVNDVPIAAPAGMVAINQPQATAPPISATQAFQADVISSTEMVTVVKAAGSDVVTTFTAQNIINWDPLDTANSDDLINILPTGTALTFVGPSSGFTVLNRILPTGTNASGDPRGIAFNGNVSSRLDAIDGSIGGDIWFYSPGGIVIGADSIFDVGGLLLTTNNIDMIDSTMSFSGNAGSTSSIIIENGATINALNDRSSYVAMVAPRIVQGGDVNVDGSVAYVAAEQADLTINNGLFDISIGVGTSDANGVVHTGTTTGPASAPSVNGDGEVTNADAQSIYLVAVPKNDALTMLVGGSIGYEQAASASVVNGNIVLSAGGNVTVGGIATAPTNSIEENITSTAAANIQIGGAGGAVFDSTLELFSTDDITLSALSDTDSIVISNPVGSQDLNLTAGNEINLNTSGGGQILVNGDVNLTAGSGATGGNININIDRTGFGTPVNTGLVVSGDLTMDATATGLDDFFSVVNNGGTGIGQDAVGGNIAINITGGGVLDVGGNTRFLTSAQGGKGEIQNGFGQAGNIVFTMDSGTVLFGGDLDFDASVLNTGDGKIAGNGVGLLGSNSTAGNIDLILSGGEMTVIGNLGLSTYAIATSGSDETTSQNNVAVAGAANLDISGGVHSIGSLDISAYATGGSSFDANGNGIAGDVSRASVDLTLSNSDTSLTVTDFIVIDATTTGNVVNDPALDAVAINIVNTGGESGLAVANDIDVYTSASNGGPGGALTAGSVSIVADNGDVSFSNLYVDTSIVLFSENEMSPLATAGNISLIAQNGGEISGDTASFYANSDTESTVGIDAFGGDVLLHANEGFIVLTGDLDVNTSARGGVKDPADLETTTAQGGTIRMLLEGTSPVTSRISASNIDFNADGSIVAGVEITPIFEGNGGSGFGGDVIFDLLGGTFVANDIEVSAGGAGGEGGIETALAPAILPMPGIAAMAAPMDLTVVDAPMAGGISAGDGGDGQGGDVTFNLNGGNATVTNLTISADGFGGNGASGDILSGTAGGNGGRGIGGNATFNAISGNLTITNTLTVSAEANNPATAPYAANAGGGYGLGSDGGNGGAGLGGTATFNMMGSATIDAANIQVSTSATGGSGGTTADRFDGVNTINGGPAGSGGDATGGDAVINDTSGTLTFGSATVQSSATGGDGGSNLDNNGVGFGNNTGGNGGAAQGGTATINLNQDNLDNRNFTVDASATGGQGEDGLTGGDGGDAFGGVAAININGASVDLDDPIILANATGGNGGQGKTDALTNNNGNSGNGGSATAGTARLQVTGAGGNIDLDTIILEANATGGNGAAGLYRFGGGIEGGDGGSGGNATGGTVELVARTGGTITLISGDFTMTSTGTGGTGGDGGNSYDSAAGDAGNGGDATGGTGRLLAQGGTISGNNLQITAAGIAGDGGIRGIHDIFGTDGADGTGGNGTGGTGIIEVQEGSPGIVTFADVTVNANGTGGGGPIAGFGAGGRIEISDSSIDPAGLISFDSLTANAFDTAIGTGTGSSSAPLGGFFATGNSGAMSILGNLVVDVAGHIEYDFDGNAQMTVGGDATLISGQNILINHSNNSTLVNSLDVTGTFDATAQANFISTDGSRINAGGTASVRAEQDATVADIAGVGLVDISALQNVAVNNAAVTGVPTVIAIGLISYVTGPELTINAGYDPTGTPLPTFDSSYNATVTGDVTSTGLIAIGAGGNAYFRAGSNVVSDNGLAVRTGDDIVIEAGASLTAANNPSTAPDALSPFSDPGNLILQAGDFSGLFGSPIGMPLSAPLSPIASIIATGDLNANGFAVVMTANAVDGLGGTITADSISVDSNNAPSNSVPQSDDNGLLSAQCLEGNVCLGTLNAGNLVYIGQASNNDVIQAVVESGTVSANDILVTTRRDIVMGTTGIATTLNASNQLALESTEGDIDLADVSATSNAITVNAAGSLLGTANLDSTSDIGITVGADINAASITTDGQLTTASLVGGAPESLYTVPGSIAVGVLTQNSDFDINIVAGGDISFDQINLPANRSITLTAATGDAFLGSNSSATSVSILGNNVGFNDLLSSGGITLNATTGDLTGTGPGDLTAGGSINLDAANAIDIGNAATTGLGQSINLFANDITAGALATDSGDILVSAAQNITLGSAATSAGTPTAGSIGLLAGNDIASTGTLNAGEDVAIRALGDVSLATVSAGDDVSVDADGAISLASATASGTGIDLFALSFNTANAGQAGSIAFAGETLTGSNIQLDSGSDVTATGALDALDNINVTATGTPTVANAISGGDTTITGASVTLNNGTIGGNLTLAALAGDIDGNGSVIVGGDIDLDATGNVGFGDLDAQGGTFTVDAGGNINFASAASRNGTTLNAGGNITGGDMSSADDITIMGSGDANLGLVNSSTNVIAQLQGAFVASEVNADKADEGDVDISADNGIDIADVSGNDIYLTAATGLVNVTNNVDVTNSIVASGEAVSIITQQDTTVSAEATNGDVELFSAAGLRIQSAQATGDISMNAVNDILIDGSTSAGNQLLITADGLIDIQAEAIGSTIETVSADMNIGSTGSLGLDALTSDIEISSNGSTQMRLGDGTDFTGTFSLSNDEFNRIRSGGNLTFYAAETGLAGYDLTIQDLWANAFFDGNFGTDGNFNLIADQSINVIGDLSVQGSFETNLNLQAGNDLFVNAATGSVAIRNDNSLSGNLSLTARNIYAMTDQAYDDIQGMNTAEKDARLAQNDGNVRENGFIVAGAISVTLLASQFYVQNTGSGTDFDARRGFVAGDGGLTINSGPSGITPIVINGIINDVTGIAVIPATAISGAGYDPQSTINGCLIANPASCGPTPPPTPTPDTPQLNDPVQDVIEEEVTPEKYEADPLATNLIEIKENEDLINDPLIDEPVTGAGNDDLWVREFDCELNNSGQCQTDEDEDEEELEPAE